MNSGMLYVKDSFPVKSIRSRSVVIQLGGKRVNFGLKGTGGVDTRFTVVEHVQNPRKGKHHRSTTVLYTTLSSEKSKVVTGRGSISILLSGSGLYSLLLKVVDKFLGCEGVGGEGDTTIVTIDSDASMRMSKANESCTKVEHVGESVDYGSEGISGGVTPVKLVTYGTTDMNRVNDIVPQVTSERSFFFIIRVESIHNVKDSMKNLARYEFVET